MDNDSYRKNAYKLLAGISDRELREDENLAKLAAELLNRRRLADEEHKLPRRTMTTWFPMRDE